MESFEHLTAFNLAPHGEHVVINLEEQLAVYVVLSFEFINICK